MKRTMPWSDDDGDFESSNSGADEEASAKTKTKSLSIASQVNSAKRKGSAVDFEVLRRHGYKGGPSVLKVRRLKEDEEKRDWSWSTGKEKHEAKENEKEGEESYEERHKTRAAVVEGEELARVQTRKKKRELSFSHKEKRKRELGQASRGKNYVEEEKRLLRDNGVYSGFDT